jgi:hypothetical protein
MPPTDVIAFLSLIVALSAYLATIRLRLIDRIKKADENQKKRLKLISFWLTFADAPLIVSGVLLFLHGFWGKTLGSWWFASPTAPGWLLPWSVGLFWFGGLFLVGHHIAAWWKSITAV